jgi:hypothetical protein
MPSPNCTPIWEYVAIPLGSSSAAPVIKPGPSFCHTDSSPDGLCGFEPAGIGSVAIFS